MTVRQPADFLVIDMLSVLSATCPNCKTSVGDDDRRCGRCGAAVSAWPSTSRAPLILPDNPALSEDTVGERLSLKQTLGGTAVGLVLAFGLLYLWSASAPDGPETVLASGSAPSMAGYDLRRAAPVPLAIPKVPPAAAVAAAPPVPNLAADPTPYLAEYPTPGPPVTPALVIEPLRAPPPPEAVPAPAAARVAPVLRMVPLAFDSLRPGDLLQLRWTLEDAETGRALPADIEFTSTNVSVASVDRRIGTVSAHAPGNVRIIVNAGAAGRTELTLTVQSPARETASGAALGKLRIRKR